jgi:hypothetical protein
VSNGLSFRSASFEKEERVLERGSSMNQKREKNLKQQKIKRKSMRKRGGRFTWRLKTC